MNTKNPAPQSTASETSRSPLRVIRVEYTPTERAELEARILRMLDLLGMEREILAPLAEPEQKGSM